MSLKLGGKQSFLKLNTETNKHKRKNLQTGFIKIKYSGHPKKIKEKIDVTS